MSPYREPGEINNPMVAKRWWWKIFGRLIYEGPEVCGQCKYWKAPKKLRDWEWQWDGDGQQKKIWYSVKGDCKLLFGKEDTTMHDNCKQFTAARKYKRRIKI